LIVISKFLRAQQSVEEVRGYECADDEHKERLNIHGIPLLHAIAEMHVGDGRGEKHNGDGNPNQVLHGQIPQPSPKGRLEINLTTWRVRMGSIVHKKFVKRGWLTA
jgi:hypothetical protein